MMIDKRIAIATVAAVVAAGLGSVGVFVASPDVDTPADVIHPDIHQKVGQGAGDNANANPEGNNGNGSAGGQIHGIANVPGQNGDHPNNDGVNGFANELATVHGGIDAYNPQS